MAQPHVPVTVLVMTLSALTLSALAVACQSSQQDQSDRRRTQAVETCEEAVRSQLSSRATAQFSPDSEHVFYDSAGGAAITGVVQVLPAPRKFACILTPASESTWTLSAARLLN